MSKFTTLFNNFSGGKITEKMKGLFNTPTYQNSSEGMLNMFPDKLGGAFKRTGSIDVGDITNTLASTAANAYRTGYRMIPFVAGDGNSYSILVTNHTITLANFATYLHIYRNDSEETPTIYGASEITERNFGKTWTPNTATLNTNLNNWKYTQVGDILFLTHASGEQRPLTIVRTAEDAFEINYYDQHASNAENFNIIHRVPFTAPNISNINLSVSGTTMTSSVAFFQNSMAVSQTLIRLNIAGVSHVYRVTAFASTTSVTVAAELGGGNHNTDDWHQSAWRNPTNVGLAIEGFGWPKSVAYHNQRLVWGGNLKFPDTVWGSLVGNLLHMNSYRMDQDSSTDVTGLNFFGDPVPNSDPLFLPVGSTEASPIQWLVAGRVLTVGTLGGEYLIPNFGTDTMEIRSNSSYGSSPYQAIKMGKDMLFVGASKRNLRTYRYSEDNGSWVSDDLTVKIDNFNDGNFVLSPYGKSIIDFAWNAENKLLFVATTSGSYVLGHDPEFGINGWADFELAVEDGHTAVIQSLVSLRGPSEDNEEIFMLVRRNNGSSDTYHIEKLTIPYFESTVKFVPPSYSGFNYYTNMDRFPRFLDLATHVQANGSGVATGMKAELIGRVVTATYFDGDTFAYIDNIDVITDGASGSELDYSFPVDVYIIFGYVFDAELITLPPEAGGQYGTSLADIKHIHETTLKLYRTMNFSIGSKDKRSGTDLTFEEVSFDDLTTTDHLVHVSDNPDTDGQVIVRSTTPTPLNILALINKGVSYD